MGLPEAPTVDLAAAALPQAIAGVLAEADIQEAVRGPPLQRVRSLMS